MRYKLLGACVGVLFCAASSVTIPVLAQGLTHVELLALQQQLRDDGCGLTHVSGRVDAATRAAIKQCESKYPGATGGRSMLVAMQIGFGHGEPLPTLAVARSAIAGSSSAGGISGAEDDSAARGTIDLERATPVTPPRSTIPRPVTPEDTSTSNSYRPRMRDTTSMPADTFPRHDTIPSRDTLPRRDTMPTMPTMPNRDTLPRRDTIPKPDTMPHTMPHFTHSRI